MTYDDISPKRLRSPPYPYIPLPKAVERVKQLQPKALHHEVGLSVLADAWSYGIKSSGLIQTAAALIQFGLMVDSGSGEKRKFQLTKEALRIALDADPDSERRRELIQSAALTPKIHKELWGKFGIATVSDLVIRNYLMFDRTSEDGAAFGSEAASAVINEYKHTISFAEIESAYSLPGHDDGSGGEEKEKQRLESTTKGEHIDINRQPIKRAERKVGMKEDVFSLTEGDVVLQWPEQLSAESYRDLEDWAQIILRKIKRSVPADNDITSQEPV